MLPGMKSASDDRIPLGAVKALPIGKCRMAMLTASRSQAASPA